MACRIDLRSVSWQQHLCSDAVEFEMTVDPAQQVIGGNVIIKADDNSLYLLHPQLARLGQFTLSARNYFEWIGQRDSLALEAACYSSGVRELRQGEQIVVLATDGLLEFGDRPYEDPGAFAGAIGASTNLSENIRAMMLNAHTSGATDSATVVAWCATCEAQGLMPTS